MNGLHRNRLLALIFWLTIPGLTGCAELDGGLCWPLGGKTSDVVPGIPSPADQVTRLRKIGQKAAWAKPAEQERLSGELAAAFPEEADPLTRAEIVRAVTGYPTAAARSVLQDAVSDRDADVRIAACRAWGKRGGPEALAMLSQVLSSDMDSDVRLAAARALGQTGDPGAISALAEALEDRDPAMQYLAVSSLRKLSDQDFGNDVNQWRQYVKGETPTPSKPVSIVERVRQMF